MLQDSLKLIAEAEKQAELELKRAREDANAMIAQAKAQVEELTAAVQAQLREERKRLTAQAEADAARQGRELMEQTRAQCLAMQLEAERRMEAVADVIAERIVQS